MKEEKSRNVTDGPGSDRPDRDAAAAPAPSTSAPAQPGAAA